MKKAYLAFYKGNEDWFDRLIQWWTKGNYSHVELVVDGFWMSSSRPDGGIRTKMIDPKPENWDMVEIPWADVDRAVAWFRENDGKLYDTRGLLGFAFRVVSDQKAKYFCSEAVATALGFDEAWRLDPNTFAAVVKRVTLEFYQKNLSVTTV